MVGDVRPALLMLASGVLLMLIVAGVNVANLLIARGLARRRELSVRAAVGASRVRLLRQLATEAVVLASGGAVVGLFVAFVALKGLLVLAPAELPRVAEIGIGGRALAFTAGIAMLAAVLFGMLPAFQSGACRTGRGAPGAGRQRRSWHISVLAAPWARDGADRDHHARPVDGRSADAKLRPDAEAGRRVYRPGPPSRRGGHPSFSLRGACQIFSAPWCGWPSTSPHCRESAVLRRLLQHLSPAHRELTPRYSRKASRSTNQPIRS